jgi:hypothetical protein
MLLFFFFNFSALGSLDFPSPQKLFFAFICGCGFGSPLLKKLLWLAVGRCWPGARYGPCGCVGTGAGRACCGMRAVCHGPCISGVEWRVCCWRFGRIMVDWSPNCLRRRSVSLSTSACFRRFSFSSRSFCLLSCSRNWSVCRSSSASRLRRAFFAASAWRSCSRCSASTCAFSRAVSASISHCARGSNRGPC